MRQPSRVIAIGLVGGERLERLLGLPALHTDHRKTQLAQPVKQDRRHPPGLEYDPTTGRRCQWRQDFPQKWRRKIPQLAGWRSAVRWIGASVFWRSTTARQRRWDWRSGGERFGASDVREKVCMLA